MRSADEEPGYCSIWLFGVATGMTNACALGEPSHHRTDDCSYPARNTITSTSGVGKVNCLDLCEGLSIGTPQLKGASWHLPRPAASRFRLMHPFGAQFVRSPSSAGWRSTRRTAWRLLATYRVSMLTLTRPDATRT